MSKYVGWSKEKLIAEIKQLKKTTYGLIWDDKPEEVAELCKEKLPVLVEAEGKKISTEKNGSANILIEGDNYHALAVLSYTHGKKVDVIYIDPPYNTGARDWKYNNAFVDAREFGEGAKMLSMKCMPEVTYGIKKHHMGIRFTSNLGVD